MSYCLFRKVIKHAGRRFLTCVFYCAAAITCLPLTTHALNAQKKAALPTKLPSAEKIVDNYLKAIGGKKIIATIKDASYDWTIQQNDQVVGSAHTERKAPSSERFDMQSANGSSSSATNASSAWAVGVDNRLRTLIGPEGTTRKLLALLNTSRLLNFKKSNVLARVVSLGDIASEPAYIVEFSTRTGAKLQYYFSVQTALITKITDDLAHTRTSFEDYRPEQGVLEPHRIRVNGSSGELVLLLRSVTYNSGIANRHFDPPNATEEFDVVSLLREVGKNQDEVERRVTEYAFTQKETDREISSKGELKKETVKVYEVFPVANREPIEKLISENGVPLSPERAAREEKRVQEEFEKAERNKERDQRNAAQRRTERQKKNRAAGREENDDPEISQFLSACQFVSPRREKFAGRDTIVFDFRPRPGFRPSNKGESLIAKLVGAIWIDPMDKQVIRLEARLAEGFKMAGGLLVSLKPGAAMVMEQTRMADGVWLPRFAQINLSVKVLLFGGGDYNKIVEWSDYKHFSGDVKGFQIEGPKP